MPTRARVWKPRLVDVWNLSSANRVGANNGHDDQRQRPAWLPVGCRRGAGHAGPWGVSFTANLTPDRETGLGNWSQRNFMDAIRTGRHQGRGRPILPPMPIQVYKNFTDQDLGAIYAYLRTIPALRSAVPEPLPPPPEATPAPN